MLLKANKYRKDKKADCRQNELGSRIFVGRVFVDYAKCLHFYPSFSYGRIIAGEKAWRFSAPARPLLPAVRAVSGICEDVPKAAKISSKALQYEKSPPFQGKRRGSNEKYGVKAKFALWITPECKQHVLLLR